jgi:hypothetical protein
MPETQTPVVAIFFQPVRFFSDVNDSLDPHVSPDLQANTLLAAGLSWKRE